MAKQVFVPDAGREGHCYDLAVKHLIKQGEGTLIHVHVWSPALKKMIGHALIETKTGFIYEPVSDQYFLKQALYQMYKVKEIARYTFKEALDLVLKHKHFGPWEEKTILGLSEDNLASLWNEGREIALQLGNGLFYDGPQTLKDEFFGHSFTDREVTGSSFICKDMESCKEKLIKLRKAFKAKPPEFLSSSGELTDALIQEGEQLVSRAERISPSDANLVKFKNFLEQAKRATTHEARTAALRAMETTEAGVRELLSREPPSSTPVLSTEIITLYRGEKMPSKARAGIPFTPQKSVAEYYAGPKGQVFELNLSREEFDKLPFADLPSIKPGEKRVIYYVPQELYQRRIESILKPTTSLDVLQLGKELSSYVPGYKVEVFEMPSQIKESINRFHLGTIDDRKKKVTINLFRGASREDALAILAHEYGHLIPGTDKLQTGLGEVGAWRQGAVYAKKWNVMDSYKRLAVAVMENYQEIGRFPNIVRDLGKWLAEEGVPTNLDTVLEKFGYPAPEEMEIGGDIGKLKVSIPPPRGSPISPKKKEEIVKAWKEAYGDNAVLRTSEHLDNLVSHLGYTSVTVEPSLKEHLISIVTTDEQIKDQSQEKLRESVIVQDEQLSSRQKAHLELARSIANSIFPGISVWAAIIPPASDRVRTAGMYGTTSGTIFISLDQLSSGRGTVDTLTHELGHHKQFKDSGLAEDLTEGHSKSMSELASHIVKTVSTGQMDKALKGVSW